jgi:hypothetical protein
MKLFDKTFDYVDKTGKIKSGLTIQLNTKGKIILDKLEEIIIENQPEESELLLQLFAILKKDYGNVIKNPCIKILFNDLIFFAANTNELTPTKEGAVFCLGNLNPDVNCTISSFQAKTSNNL